MRFAHFLYGIVILVVVGLFACYIGYTTDTLPMDTLQQEYAAKPRQTVKKKSCACCAEKQKRKQEMMRQWLNETAPEKP